MNDPSQVSQRSFGNWPPAIEDPMGFPNLSRPPPFAAGHGGANPGRMNWKAKKAADKRKSAAGTSGLGGVGPIGYNPTTLNELQYQNRVKARRFFYPKKKFPRAAPFAPRNTTSFIIRAKKSGGIASLVSPCPVTPAVLPTPKLSPTREDLADMVKKQWGVDGYGSMKGLIRLRSPGAGREDDVEDEQGSSESESEVEEHLEVERRLDHDVSRFEMVYPGEEHSLELPTTARELLESRMDDQDARIARLEEENMVIKERLFVTERGIADLAMKLQLLESRSNHGVDDNSNNDGNHNKCSDSGNAGNDKNGDGEECSAESTGNPLLE